MRRRVLIAEDNGINRELLRRILESEYDVLECENGQEALAHLQAEHDTVSAVILDLDMPVMDGFQVLEKMRGNIALAQIPVVVATGSYDEATEVRALTLGANDFVNKPYNPVLIRHCLRMAINLRETASMVNALQRDKLTGLYSREAFFERAEAMIREHEPGYYIMSCFDIDNFKLINDQYGTGEGDRILQHIGKTVQEDVTSIGGICSRISADNFAQLYPAERGHFDYSKVMWEARLIPPNIHAAISLSVGRYVVNDTALPASTLYDRAYIAKRSIKGRYDKHMAYFDETMLSDLLREQEIIGGMDTALEQGQFEIWFQPQFNHATGALIGAEALVRWRHPEKGMIPPNDFIPIFEQNGFVYEVDKYVWEQTCRYLRRWTDEGRSPLPVSVNISRYDLFRADIVEVIASLTEKYEIPAAMLRLEITESAFAKSTEHVVSVVRQLMDRGFVVEIDDFGSGYSSLNTLKDVPADVLKLDMRFLESTGNSPRGGNILESVVRMAKWLGMSVIAEGVETAEQAEFLKSIGCLYIQGYLYARPMPVEEYERTARTMGKEKRLLAMETVKNLDNNAFWDPNSMDTLIFNSYIGGACVFEYCNEKIELLRANDKYAQVIGFSGMTVEDALKLEWMEHLDAEDAAALRAALQKSIETGSEVTEELAFINLPGCAERTYLRSSMRVIATAGDRRLVYCTNENITAQRQAEQKEKRTAEQLRAIMNDVGSGITATVLTDGKPRFLLTNDKYFELLGFTRQQYAAEVEDIYELIRPECRAYVMKASMDAYRKKRSTQLEYRITRRDGMIRWIRAILSVTRFSDNAQPVQLGVFTDVTEEKNAQQELFETDEHLRFLNETAHDLLAQPDTEKAIDGTLAKLMGYFDGSRAYVFEFDYDRSVASNTYEVCAEGVTREKENLQEVPFEVVSFWIHAFDQKKYIDIPNVDALDHSRAEEKATLQAQGIHSLIAVPLQRDGGLVGFIGIDDPKRQHFRVDRLVALGDYITVMLTRRDLSAKIFRDNETLTALMNDTPGAFVRMRLCQDGRIVPIFFNAGFSKLTGMDREELTALYGADAMAGVHPEDVPTVRSAVKEMLAKGTAHSAKYRVRRGDGSYVWLVFYGRAVQNSNGETYINLYYTDAAERSAIEEERRELLDNLPCGAALYELDGDKLTAVHLNKRYRELVERPLADLSQTSVLDAIHPEDRAGMLSEVHSAIAEKRDAACTLRVLRGTEGDYRTFRVSGRIIPREGGKYAVFATYAPVTADALAYQQMLPVALSAVMSNSPDIAFVKDISYRYVCCSRAFVQAAGLNNEREVIGKTDHDLLDKELADQYRASDESLVREKQPRVNYSEILPAKNGPARYCNTSKYPLLDQRGDVIGIYGVSCDVTEARTTDVQLRFLADSILGGLATYRCAPSGIKMTYFNDGFCRLFGYTHEEYEEIVGENFVSPIFQEDVPELMRQYSALMREGTPMESTCRVRVKGGGYKWISYKAVAQERINDAVTVNAVFLDVTELQETTERLRISEEEHRLAAEHTGNVVCRYHVKTRTLTLSRKAARIQGLPEVIEDVPGGSVHSGRIAPETAPAYIKLYESILQGEKNGRASFRLRRQDGTWRWVEGNFSTIFSADGKPASAVVSFTDITDQLEKETVYKKWQQSLSERDPESYTLFRCNLSQQGPLELVEGLLLQGQLELWPHTLREWTNAYAEGCVFPEDQEKYLAFVNPKELLDGLEKGRHTVTLEYREKQPNGGERWIRLSVDMVEYPKSTDVEAYLMYEDIDQEKQAEILTLRQAETDPLTGVLNRRTFAAKVEQAVRTHGTAGKQHALFMLDIDGFKMVNDVFGHAAGDQTLVELTQSLRGALRREDLLGRLGGDEFVVFLSDIPNDAVAMKKAKQLCALMRRSFSMEVQISGSVGIAVCPRDGGDFDELYRKADVALYYVKGSGKDSYAFYRPDMENQHLELDLERTDISGLTQQARKRRMLIVDDSNIDYEVMKNLFKDEFFVEKAQDGETALVRLRHYGSAISVVLLDLMMPGMDGFAVLEKMRTSPEMQAVPVVVVSGAEDREMSLRAIRAGASDFVTKPVDPDLLRLRVRSAISKAENERLRAQNSLLETQNSELDKYHLVLEQTGTALVMCDWIKGVYTYDSAISTVLFGIWDQRSLWRILLSDGVAEPETVKELQEFFRAIAEDRTRTGGSMGAVLKSAEGVCCWFRINIYKKINDYQLTDKLVITMTRTKKPVELSAAEAAPSPDGGATEGEVDGRVQ